MNDVISYDHIYELGRVDGPCGIRKVYRDGSSEVLWFERPAPTAGLRIVPGRELPRCECGAASLGSPFHSDWCPLA